MSFEEDFPSLVEDGDRINWKTQADNKGDIIWARAVITKCLDKQKVREAIDNLISEIDNEIKNRRPSKEKLSLLNIFRGRLEMTKKELGLKGDE